VIHRVPGRKARVKKQGGISGISYFLYETSQGQSFFVIRLAAFQASGGAET
jgi:hypothetical protein